MPSNLGEDVKKRSNGIAARERILDAAAEIATERGYEATSISLVSERSGLPASSIYWHFQNKDDLIASVIERSFDRWREAMKEVGPIAPGASLEESVEHQSYQSVSALEQAPEFLRLGLMLALEKRPDEPAARKRFNAIRANALNTSKKTYARLLPDLDADDIDCIARFSIALADGLFVARQAGDEVSDVVKRHDLHAAALLGIIRQLRAAKG